MNFGKLALEPVANLAYLNLDTDGFSERGGSENVAFTTLGLHVGNRVNLSETAVLALSGTRVG
ncbi:autotransporter domain-containing protein [Bosea sp. 685]|uniref:autotransporter domain-containing protein n=1 Tax=Bosea sp. 685 TaxID=3080057 RepID=UPI0028936F48|nr:autotransporter domain-containing protein [Bosea sp. 685]WNJ93544.1 hypothetical protein RMR04_15175 [Bosea sp. 685]